MNSRSRSHPHSGVARSQRCFLGGRNVIALPAGPRQADVPDSPSIGCGAITQPRCEGRSFRWQDGQKRRPTRPQQARARGVPSELYVEGLSEARTPSAALFTILLGAFEARELGKEDRAEGEYEAKKQLRDQQGPELAVIGGGLDRTRRGVFDLSSHDVDVV